MTQTIAVIGGSGNLGAALARRWAKAGRRVIIGSRDAAKAGAAAAQLAAELGVEPGAAISGDSNLEAARRADVVVVAVPFASQLQLLEEIRPGVVGKVVIDTTVPLMPPKVMRVQLPAEGSAAQRAQALLGAEVRLVSAFHNVAAHKLATDEQVQCDVLVFGDDKAARAVAVELAQQAACAACTPARWPTRRRRGADLDPDLHEQDLPCRRRRHLHHRPARHGCGSGRLRSWPWPRRSASRPCPACRKSTPATTWPR
jgi:hypothetical protein